MLEDVDRSIDNHSRDPLRRSGVNKVVNNVRQLFVLLNDFNYEVKKNIEISTHLFCINLIIYLYIWMYYMQWHFFILDEKDSRKERIKSKVSSISNVKKEKQYHKINQLQVTHIWISFSLSVKKMDCMSKVKQSLMTELFFYHILL